MLSEPPGADPHAGWCGRARVILAPTRFCAGGAASNGRPYRNRSGMGEPELSLIAASAGLDGLMGG